MHLLSESMSFQAKVVEDLVLTVELEIREELTIDYLSHKTGYSAGHLSKLFKKLKGISLATYVRERKIAFAAQEMAGGKRFIVDIAIEYGFSSQSSFCRTFKSVIGVTPKEYRDEGGLIENSKIIMCKF